MTEIPSEEKASRPIGMAAMLGLLIGICSHELLLHYLPTFLWFSLGAIFPGLYILQYDGEVEIWVLLNLMI